MNPPKPTALKVLNGSARTNPGRLNVDEPKPEPLTAVPEPPVGMPAGVARDAWARIAGQAIALRVLTAVDLDALALTCRALADYYDAGESDDAWHRSDAAWKRAMAGLQQFGLTPSSRTRVHAAPKAKDDAMSGLLTPKRKTS